MLAVQPNGLRNSQKTFHKTFGTNCCPKVLKFLPRCGSYKICHICTLNDCRILPGYGKTGRMAGTGQGGRFSLSGQQEKKKITLDVQFLEEI